MDQPEKQSPDNEGAARRHRVRKHSRHSKKKKSRFKRIVSWAKKNPSKAIAIFSVALIIVITVLFYLYNVEMLNATEEIPLAKSPVKGIALPIALISESSPVQIIFGKSIRQVTLEELRSGYAISPEAMFNCETEKTAEDRTKFVVFLVENRLYLHAGFRDLFSDEIIATIDNKKWTGLNKNSSGFYSDENSFHVSDKQGHTLFDMRFNAPDSLFIRGYFSGKNCVYVIGNNTIYSDHKIDNYKDKVLDEIKKLK